MEWQTIRARVQPHSSNSCSDPYTMLYWKSLKQGQLLAFHITLPTPDPSEVERLLPEHILIKKNLTDITTFGQILEAAPHKTAVVWPLSFHFTNYQSKTNKICWTLLKISLHGHTSVGKPSKTYIHQLSVDTGWW